MIVSPFFAGLTKFSNNLAGFSMHMESVRLDKPVYVTMTILDDSKTLIYDFYYNTLKKQYGAKSEHRKTFVGDSNGRCLQCTQS